MGIGGALNTKLLGVKLLADGSDVAFEQEAHRIILKNLPDKNPDTNAAIPVFELTFDKQPEYVPGSCYPQRHGGKSYR